MSHHSDPIVFKRREVEEFMSQLRLAINAVIDLGRSESAGMIPDRELLCVEALQAIRYVDRELQPALEVAEGGAP